MRKRRHWIRGIFGGLLLGLGLAVGSIVYGFVAFGPPTPWIMLIIGVLIGVALIFVPRPWGRRRPPTPGPAGPPGATTDPVR